MEELRRLWPMCCMVVIVVCSVFVTVSNPCRSPAFSCGSGKCILTEWVLDGSKDCEDGADEGQMSSAALPDKQSTEHVSCTQHA